MEGNNSTNENSQSYDKHPEWLKWCRLCAKRDLDEQENSIFAKNDGGRLDSDLATSIGKYFWVNIKADDAISQSLCFECKQLVQELVRFTDHVSKVQTLFCLLQNIKPTTVEQTDTLRTQCGLIDEGWEHIIKTESRKMIDPSKTFLTDQQTQTDLITISECENEQENDIQTSIETEEIINIIEKPDINDDVESQTETGGENMYEYLHGENEMEFIENDYIVPSINQGKEDNKHIANEGDDEQKHGEIFEIISKEEDLGVEYEECTESVEQDVEEIEMLEEDEEDYIDTSESHHETKIEALGLQKSKRGRPFGTKNSQTDASDYRFVCKECKRTYKNPNIFRRHMLSLHDVSVDDLPEFKSISNTCEVCNKQFLTPSSLKMHMRHHLPDEEKYNVPCPYCDRKFSQIGAMRQHVNGIHHQMKPFICDQCGRACKTLAALNEHQLVHTNECPFECEVCHKSFKNKPRLKSHMDIHNKSVYTCSDCGLELNTKRTLLQHRLVHSDVKRFKCEFCDAAFKRSKALKNHLILHSGLRPYKCNFCNKSFSNGSNCRAHKKRAHPKELAEEEANGIEPERVPIPKLEELKSAKGVLVQPRKIKRHARGLPHRLRKLLQPSDKFKEDNLNYYEDSAENYESLSDFHYEICKSEIDETESLVDNTNEECEETVIYEIIDEI